MDQIFRKSLHFDQFVLDLTRMYLRMGETEVDLRPKTFEVLRHLAENAGQLVPKQALYEAVWPNVTVTDNSLVQCIRELRQKLGDNDHSLIKTVARRGYLLDALPLPQAGLTARPPEALQALASNAALPLHPRPVLHRGRMYQLAGGLFIIMCIALSAVFLTQFAAHPTYPGSLDFKPALLPPNTLNKLFTDNDAKRVAEIAKLKQLPLPTIQIDTLDDDVPWDIRRFVGIWVSTKGFVSTGRQFMVAITHVEKGGLAGGYTVRGPPAHNSYIQNPAAAVPVTAFISDGMLTYTNPRGDYEVWFVDDELVFKQTYKTGAMTLVSLKPVWTLVDAERTAGPRHVGQ